MTDRPVMLELKKLKKYFPVKRGLAIHALEDISFRIYEGEKFGVVGESGCGKSTLGRTILQLYPPTSGACIYHGKTLEEVSPKYVKREIAELLNYQKRARVFYQKSLEVEEHIAKLDKEKDASTIAALQSRAKELRKDASRQLREGSRTVGSLILSEKLPEIAELFSLSEQESERAHAGILELAKLEAEELEERASHVASDEIVRKIGECRAFIGEHIKKSQGYREKAFEYRGKHILPITGRCLDPAYQAKLDHNYERGINLGKLTGEEMRALRRDMQIVFQDPFASLSPRMPIGEIIGEAVREHKIVERAAYQAYIDRVMLSCGLQPEQKNRYPHEFSGGQRQRIGIARALAVQPEFIVCDEPVSALDVSIQAQIINMLEKLQHDMGLTYLFIAHDLAVVKHISQRIGVMYLGKIVEITETKELHSHPIHPYTRALLSAIPAFDPKINRARKRIILEGEIPNALTPPKGCVFSTRCPYAKEICSQQAPELKDVTAGHKVACHFASDF